jgi:hypothetical protein
MPDTSANVIPDHQASIVRSNMNSDSNGQPERPDPGGRTQLETRGIQCSDAKILRGRPDLLGGELVIGLDGQRFPSLPLWDFGLIAKHGVSIEQMQELAAKINELCDGGYAYFDDRRDQFGLPSYETDKWGLAKLE